MDFKINRGQGKCSVTGRDFSDGEEYIVALKADPDPAREGVFHRMEISLEAWERQGRGDITAWWRTEFSSRKRPTLNDPDALWEIFHKARRKGETPGESPNDEPEEEAEFNREELDRFAYVAALALLRQKKLKLKRTRRRGPVDWMVLEARGRKRENAVYEVVDMNLSEDESMGVQERLADLL